MCNGLSYDTHNCTYDGAKMVVYRVASKSQGRAAVCGVRDGSTRCTNWDIT